jgi:hypothetical protein
MIVRPILSASRIHLGHGLASPQKQTCDVRLLNPLGCSWQCAKDRSVSSSSTCLALAVHAIACTATAQAWLRSSSPKWSSHPYSLQSCYKEPRYSRVREDEWFHCACLGSRWGYNLETSQELRQTLLPPMNGHYGTKSVVNMQSGFIVKPHS